MSPKQASVQIKLTISNAEAKELDRAVMRGIGTCRADICRKAMIVFLHEAKDRGELGILQENEKSVQVVFQGGS